MMKKPKPNVPAPGRMYHFADQFLGERWEIELFISHHGFPAEDKMRMPANYPIGQRKRLKSLVSYFQSRRYCKLVPLDPENMAPLVDPEHDVFGDTLSQILYWHSKWPNATWLDCETGELVCGS